MRKNLELKAKYQSTSQAVSVCSRLGARKKGLLRQTDTYFRIRDGRLKLREINGKQFELIHYRRENLKGTRFSDFFVVPLKTLQPMKDVCRAIFGTKVVVKKRRLLYLYRNARIHIDSVTGLGAFIEFEVIVKFGRKQAERLMSFLISEFRIERRQMVGGSYSDMIAQRSRLRPS